MTSFVCINSPFSQYGKDGAYPWKSEHRLQIGDSWEGEHSGRQASRDTWSPWSSEKGPWKQGGTLATSQIGRYRSKCSGMGERACVCECGQALASLDRGLSMVLQPQASHLPCVYPWASSCTFSLTEGSNVPGLCTKTTSS